MKLLFFSLVVFQATACAGPVKKLSDFELTDQNLQTRRYQFPKSKITVLTVADHKGSAQLAPWIQRLHDRYEKRIDIDGVADVSMIPRAFHGVFRDAFRKQLTRSVMLDWSGAVVRQFSYEKGVANLFVIDREGTLLRQLTGPVSDSAERELTHAIDRALSGTFSK